MRQLILLVTISFALNITASAQNFEAEQKKQEKTIKAAYKSKKITENEYNKLMEEQETIKYTIEKYKLDGTLDSHEKNVIHDKLQRAAKRLHRYKTNGEIY